MLRHVETVRFFTSSNLSPFPQHDSNRISCPHHAHSGVSSPAPSCFGNELKGAQDMSASLGEQSDEEGKLYKLYMPILCCLDVSAATVLGFTACRSVSGPTALLCAGVAGMAGCLEISSRCRSFLLKPQDAASISRGTSARRGGRFLAGHITVRSSSCLS